MEQDSVVGIVAVERQVRTQVQQLHGVAALLRDLALAQDKYAGDYSKLSVAASPLNLAACPPLQRVMGALEKTLAAVTQAHAALASELSSTVVMPLEAFEKQQKHQTKQLLSEIDDALQSERQLHTVLANAVATAAPGANTATPGSDPSDDNQDDAETDAKTPVLEETMAEARAIRAKRDREREIVRQRLGELDLTDEQQAAIVQGQLDRCFDALARHTSRVQTEVADALAVVALPSSSSQRVVERDRNTKLEDAVQASTLHIEATSWMVAVVSQLIPIEDAMVKRLQSLLKAHPLDTITTVFAPSSGPHPASKSSSSEFTTLWDFAQSHKQLTANLADPICRTLRFSRQKQETICKELVESMDATQRQIQTAKARVRDKEAKLLQYLQQEQMQQQRVQEPQPPLLGSTGTEALLSNGTFGLRNAVVSWTKQLGSPKKPLFKSKSVNGVGIFGSSSSSPPKTSTVSPPTPTCGVSVAKSPRRVNIEKVLAHARTHVQKLEDSEATQRADMIKTLESTSHIGVKTMELMVNDYLKNVAKAMHLAAAATAKCSERLATATDTKKEGHTVFRSMVVFDDSSECSEHDLAKRLGHVDEKNPAPETSVSETETDEAEEPDAAVAMTSGSRSVGDVTRTGATKPTASPLPSKQAVQQRLSAVVTELSKLHEHLQIAERAQQILELVKRVLVVVWRGLRSFVRGVARAPEQWQCVMALAIVLSLLSFVRRLDRLDDGWRQLAELQHENARSLQQLVALMGE